VAVKFSGRGLKLTRMPLICERFVTRSCSGSLVEIVNFACRRDIIVSSPLKKLLRPMTEGSPGRVSMIRLRGREILLIASRRVETISIEGFYRPRVVCVIC
jgi:hypothetical protein